MFSFNSVGIVLLLGCGGVVVFPLCYPGVRLIVGEDEDSYYSIVDGAGFDCFFEGCRFADFD